MLRVLLALVALLAVPAPALAQSDLERAGVREIIVKRAAGVSAAEVRGAADVERVGALRLTRTEVVRADPGQLDEALARLRADSDVVYAEPNAPVHALTADPHYYLLWGLHNTGQTVQGTAGTADADIDAPEAWAFSTGAGEVVGVVDSGIFAGHEDLSAQLAANPGETGGGKESNGIDDDGNGLVDDWRGWDFVDCRTYTPCTEDDVVLGPDNVPNDGHGHGTHVAGTIAAAANNSLGIAGVAYDSKVVNLRALDSGGSGSFAAVANAFDYAGDLGLKVVNASLGSSYGSQTEYNAIAAHPNTLYVVAAGNSNLNIDIGASYPCKHALPNVLCIGASDAFDARAAFSNYGATAVDVFAPGVGIASAYKDGSYVYMQGTSMASPHAAGVAALVRARNPSLTAVEVKNLLMSTADLKPALSGLAVVGGRINAHAAVQAAVADSDGDGVLDVQDNCPNHANPGQADADGDGTGDSCDPTPHPDSDGDGRPNHIDNCPNVVNPDQADLDGDGIGDACDPDDDHDAVPDFADNCPRAFNPDQADVDGDGIGDACDPVDDRTYDQDEGDFEDEDDEWTPPVLKSLKLGAKVLKLPSRKARGAREPSIAVTFTLDQDAEVALTVQRKSCVRARCKYKRAATARLDAEAGRNRYTLRRKVGSKTLGAGSYKLVLTPEDGSPAAASFTIR